MTNQIEEWIRSLDLKDQEKLSEAWMEAKGEAMGNQRDDFWAYNTPQTTSAQTAYDALYEELYKKANVAGLGLGATNDFIRTGQR
jgi:hypothetical protein